MKPIAVSLGRIEADPRLQPRIEGIDPEHVKSLEAVFEYWPPLAVVEQGDRFLLLDGYHRFAAAQNLKLDTVPVIVLKVSEGEDLHGLAFALNSAHGRPLTLSDRRAFAARLLRANPESSDREIGRRCGLTQPTVAKVRQELEQQAHIQPTETRVGRDGRSYSATQKAAGTATLGSLVENLADIFAPAERKAQRRFVRYLEKLAVILDEQHSIESFENFENAGNACRAVLGDDQAKELAESLGPASWNILQIAKALGYSEGGQ
jgi:ParB-like chromosome segregation protein Spo0J